MIKILIFIMEFSTCDGVSLSTPGVDGSQENLINVEGIDLNVHNNLTPVYPAFPGHFPTTSLSTSFF